MDYPEVLQRIRSAILWTRKYNASVHNLLQQQLLLHFVPWSTSWTLQRPRPNHNVNMLHYKPYLITCEKEEHTHQFIFWLSGRCSTSHKEPSVCLAWDRDLGHLQGFLPSVYFPDATTTHWQLRLGWLEPSAGRVHKDLPTGRFSSSMTHRPYHKQPAGCSRDVESWQA